MRASSAASAFLRERGSESAMRVFAHIDWFLLAGVVAISCLGLVTMHSFSEGQIFFERQIIWIAAGVGIFFIASLPEYRFLRRTLLVTFLYASTLFLLGLVFLFGTVVMGARERFDLGAFFVQPSDPAKVVLIILLSKYFTRRHADIAHIRHILVSGAYAFGIFVFVFFQPDLGSAVIIAMIWLGMVLVAGISWRHLVSLFIVALLFGGALWSWGLEPYQKERVLTFLHPLTDIQGAGYNAYQSTVAVGSGELTGKGIGYGTQSKLRFLPEYETDFIFAAFAEEWGLLGTLLLFGLFGIVVIRILGVALRSRDDFGSLFAAGVAMYILAQVFVHVGMNIGLLPITGTTLPYMSYGGSHLLTEYLALGILMGLRRAARPTVQARDETEMIGVL